MKYLFLLLLVGCSSKLSTYKMGDCFVFPKDSVAKEKVLPVIYKVVRIGEYRLEAADNKAHGNYLANFSKEELEGTIQIDCFGVFEYVESSEKARKCAGKCYLGYTKESKYRKCLEKCE